MWSFPEVHFDLFDYQICLVWVEIVAAFDWPWIALSVYCMLCKFSSSEVLKPLHLNSGREMWWLHWTTEKPKFCSVGSTTCSLYDCGQGSWPLCLISSSSKWGWRSHALASTLKSSWCWRHCLLKCKFLFLTGFSLSLGASVYLKCYFFVLLRAECNVTFNIC